MFALAGLEAPAEFTHRSLPCAEKLRNHFETYGELVEVVRLCFYIIFICLDLLNSDVESNCELPLID